jgi:hypothetical protein
VLATPYTNVPSADRSRVDRARQRASVVVGLDIADAVIIMPHSTADRRGDAIRALRSKRAHSLRSCEGRLAIARQWAAPSAPWGRSLRSLGLILLTGARAGVDPSYQKYCAHPGETWQNLQQDLLGPTAPHVGVVK